VKRDAGARSFLAIRADWKAPLRTLEALRLAEEKGVASMASPLSTSTHGYPPGNATWIALQAMRKTAPKLKHVRTVRFVLYGTGALDVHTRIADEAFDET